MSYADSINDEQKAVIQSWADEGDDLSSIQKKLGEELAIQVTYMEVRFLIGDLGIKMPAKEKPIEEEKEAPVAGPVVEGDVADAHVVADEASPAETNAESPVAEAAAPEESAPVATSVKVTMSEVLPPGALAGGTVTFSDGVDAAWSLNQMGQLSLDAADPAYRPTDTDVAAFQQELQKVAQEKGL